MPDSRQFLAVLRLCAASLVVAIMAGCSTTGSSFNTSSLDLLVPGHTTLNQASTLFGADPVDIYPQGDGAVLARWAHRASFVPDAVYFNRELWLAFDRNGHFERIVRSINVPGSGQAGRAHRAAQAQETMRAPGSETPVPLSDSPVASPVRL